jgi:hypothetical protein
MGGITDRLMAWKEERLWIGAPMMGAYSDGTDTLGPANGTPILDPLDAVESVGWLMAAAGDEVHFLWPVPRTWSRTDKVLARIYFEHASATTTDAPVWKVGVLFYGKQAQLAECQANADKVTTFTAHTCGSADPSLEVTKWTDLSFDDYAASTDVLMGISIECDSLGSASANEVKLIGIEFAWEVNACELVHRKLISEVESANLV